MPARILLVDDDESVRSFCAEVLGRDGLELAMFATAEDALDAAKGARFDLFLVDIRLPGMSGLQLRDKLRALPGGNAPMIFFTGADKEFEIELARSLKGEKLLLKPVAPADLRRAVKVALKLVRAEAGPIPESFDRILSLIAKDGESGVLTAVTGTTLKRVVFHDGKIAFAASNDPREVIGQAFVRAGLISEKELAAALSQREASGGKPLGAVLTALRKVTRDQADKVFAKKIREAVLELFLWRSGMVEFVASAEDSDRPFPIGLEVGPMLEEGKKRRSRWDMVQRTIPDPTVKFDVKKWPPGFPKNEGDRVLAKHVESGRTMAEIMVELRGQDYAVGVRLAELVRAGALATSASKGFVAAPFHDSVTVDMDEALSAFEDESPKDVDDGSGAPEELPSKITRILPKTKAAPTEEPDRRDTVRSPEPRATRPITEAPRNLSDDLVQPLDDDDAPTQTAPSPAFPAPDGGRRQTIPPQGGLPETVGMLTRALVLMRAGDLAGARAGLVEVLALDPLNPLARQRLTEIESALATQVKGAANLSPGTTVKLGVKLEELVGRPIPPNDAFVLTRLAGSPLTVGELVQICPLPETEILQVIERHLASGVLTKG